MINQQLNNAMKQAQVHAQHGRIVEAESAYREIIAVYPKFHPAYQDYGLLAFGAGNLLLAAELFKAAIELNNNVALYHRNYGEICRRLGRIDEAIKSGMLACKLAPSDINAHFNLGLACSDAMDHSNASLAYRAVLKLLEPQLASGVASAHMYSMNGDTLHRLGLLDQARTCYEQALKLQPDFPAALNSLGTILIDTGLVREALECFAKAVNLAPAFAMARLNLGMAQLKLGDWQHGWENYEARWTGSVESGNGSFSRPTCPLPQWNGQDASDKQGLLIYAEQGFGDLFQFSRYLSVALERFSKVGLVCPEPITLLILEKSFGERVVMLKRMPIRFDTWHWQCPLMSLPLAFKTLPNTIPSNIPYLKVSNVAQSHWRERLNLAAPLRTTIGIAWTGRKSHQYNAQRSLNFKQILPLLNDTRFTWVSLQKLETGETLPEVTDGVAWIDWTIELNDFADTAALVSNLDLVISIDSAMIHLAGALGRPVWMMNRFNGEWRWLERREHSPWYPSLRIFNQPKLGDWASVISNVQLALTESFGIS